MRLLALTPNPSVDKIAAVARLDPGRVHRTLSLTAAPGGKGNNVAFAARALGAAVRVGGIFGGHAGRWITQALADAGFSDGVFAWSDGETRACMILLEKDADRTTVINEDGPVVQAAVVGDFIAKVQAAAAGFDWVSISGSLPAGAGTEHWRPLIAAARSGGAKVALDAGGKWLAAVADAGVDLLRINADEAGEWTGSPVRTPDQAATAVEQLRRRGTGAAVISLGGDGVVGATAAGIVRVQVPQAPIVNPIGAGDTMLAGLMTELSAGTEFAQALRRAAALATAKCLKPSGSLFDRGDYERLLKETKIV